MYADLFNVAHKMFSIMVHGVAVEACCSLGQGDIGWRHPTTTGKTLCKNIMVMRFS
jgi:hypothetical protein